MVLVVLLHSTYKKSITEFHGQLLLLDPDSQTSCWQYIWCSNIILLFTLKLADHL